MVVMIRKAKYKKRINQVISLVSSLLLVLQIGLPAISQSNECIRTRIDSVGSEGQSISVTEGNTNNDDTYNGIDNYADIDLSSDNGALSVTVFKGNSAKIFKVGLDGSVILSDTEAKTDPVSGDSGASTRGIGKFSPDGSKFFLLGNGPAEAGFDRIYPYSVELSGLPSFTRIKKDGANNFFIPPDLSTALTVTPNNSYLVYLQGNTSNKNIASLHSVKIKDDNSLNNSSTGESSAKILEAGSFIEFAKTDSSTNSRFAFGAFSDLQHGKNASGDGFGIFKTNLISGYNIILGEFKKGSLTNPLPPLLNTPSFVGISGLKLVEKNGERYLIISFVESNSSKTNITKLALFRVNIRSELSKAASITQVGLPITTTFKSEPCETSSFNGISGPIDVVGDNVYIVDNNSNGNNHFASYYVDFDRVASAEDDKEIFRLSSTPVRVSTTEGQRSTDIAVSSDNRYAYIATSHKNDFKNNSLLSFTLRHSNTKCSTLQNKLEISGLCDLNKATPKLATKIPNQEVEINKTKEIKLWNHFKSSENLSYKFSENPASAFISLSERTITITPQEEESVGKTYENITILAEDSLGQVVSDSFNIKVVRKASVAEQDTAEPPVETAMDSIPPPIAITPPLGNLGVSAPSLPSGSSSSSSSSNSNLPPPGIGSGGRSNNDLSKLRFPGGSSFPQANRVPNFPRPTGNMIGEPTISDIPIIDLIPTEDSGVKLTQSIDVKKLNLSGPDQIIIAPKIPHLIYTSTELQEAQLSDEEDEEDGDDKKPNIKLSKGTIEELSVKEKEVKKTKKEKVVDDDCGKCEGSKIVGLDNAIPSCSEDGYIRSCDYKVGESPNCCRLDEPDKCNEKFRVCQRSKKQILEDIAFEESPENKESTESSVVDEIFNKVIARDKGEYCHCDDGKLICDPGHIPICAGGAVKCTGESKPSCCKDDICNNTPITYLDASILDGKTGSISVKDALAHKKLKNKDPKVVSEIRGAIKGGVGGYIVFLKKGVKVKSKDLKNIIYAVVDKKGNATVLSSATSLLGPGKLLSKLSFPKKVKVGKNTLVVLLNKGGGKKEVLAKGALKIYNQVEVNNYNIDNGTKKPIRLPRLSKVEGRVVGKTDDGTQLIRLTFIGKNFASRLLESKEELFISKPEKTNTIISFIDERGLEVKRTRVLQKGNKILVTIKYSGRSLSKIPFTISTPQGQLFKERLGVKLHGNLAPVAKKAEKAIKKPTLTLPKVPSFPKPGIPNLPKVNSAPKKPTNPIIQLRPTKD